LEWRNKNQLYRPKPPYEFLDVNQKYSYIKTPVERSSYGSRTTLARMLVGYASGREEFKEIVDSAFLNYNFLQKHYSLL
jgi:Ni,Fe-hydrogenase I large subunit